MISPRPVGIVAFVLLGCASNCQDVTATGWQPPANSDLAVSDSFEGGVFSPDFKPTIGDWRVANGVLKGSEVPSDAHAAAARYHVVTSNAAYQLKFQLSSDTKSFHVGFDPARGQLDKKGHLFSVIVTPTGWRILKHLDKNRREEDPNEIMAQAKVPFEADRWYDLRITTWGPYVTARMEGMSPLKASHPTFAVEKPAVVFRCMGKGVKIDDLRVWTQRDSR